MTDTEILKRIHDLVASEHETRAAVLAGSITPEEEHTRLNELEVQLDQLWDLLRRRRAARRAGTDPDEVTERPTMEVENYLQ
jgi:hypothetical protein